MTTTFPLEALGVRQKFRVGETRRRLSADFNSATKTIEFWSRANIAKDIYLFIDENEYADVHAALPEALKSLAILRPSIYSSTHASMQQWHLDFLRDRHPGTVIGLMDGDFPIHEGVSQSSKQFPELDEIPPVRTKNYVSPSIAGDHIRRAVPELERLGISLGGFPIDPPTTKQAKGCCAYLPIDRWVVQAGYVRNFLIVFPTFQGRFGSPIGGGLGVLEDAHFALSGGRENVGMYQGLCLRFGAAKGSSKRNTNVASEAEKRELAESLGLPFAEIKNYMASRYIKKILPKNARQENKRVCS